MYNDSGPARSSPACSHPLRRNLQAWLRLVVGSVLLVGGSRIVDLHAIASEPVAPASVEFDWELGPTGTKASLRGLGVGADGSVWASGSGGTVLRSEDGGSRWEDVGPADASEADFRSIHAWDRRRAIIASTTAPAVVLLTTDGGASWREVFRESNPRAFFDALRFYSPDEGLLFGDPTDGVLWIGETRDGGRDWRRIDRRLLPEVDPGTAGFAASNSALVVAPDGRAWIGTGGAERRQARIYFRPPAGAAWRVADCPLPSGPSRGVFSIALGRVQGRETLVAVGGDYRSEESSRPCAASSTDGGATWVAAAEGPGGYRSAVAFFQSGSRSMFVCTGPGGSDGSADGMRWHRLSSQGFHVLAASGNRLYAAGADGRFARLAERSRQGPPGPAH